MKKNVIITGAAGNLGKAVVQKFIKEGYRVIAIVLPSDSLEDQPGDDLVVYKADLSDEDDAKKTIEKIYKDYAEVHAALLLAGGYAFGGIGDADGEVLKKMFTLNFETAYYTARPVFEKMMDQKDGGKILMMGARPALNAKEGKNSLAYALSKSLIFKLADMLNAEGASKNVTATVVAPSIIDTPPNRKAMPDADFDKWVKPGEIADVMAFACSDKSNVLRETVLKVYGKV